MIGAPVHSSLRTPRLNALLPRDQGAIFVGLKKVLGHRHFFI
jgi:hypothetical protein